MYAVVLEKTQEYNDVFFDAYNHKFAKNDKIYSKRFEYLTHDLKERKALEIYNTCENIEQFVSSYETISYDKIVLWNALKRVEAICEEDKNAREKEEEQQKSKGKRR